jgi:hypothetical protein
MVMLVTRVVILYAGMHVQLLHFSDFKQIWGFWQTLLAVFKMQLVTKILPAGTYLFYADGNTRANCSLTPRVCYCAQCPGDAWYSRTSTNRDAQDPQCLGTTKKLELHWLQLRTQITCVCSIIYIYIHTCTHTLLYYSMNVYNITSE